MSSPEAGGSAPQAAKGTKVPGIADTVARVEAELASFWATPDESEGAPVSKTRASTMTYVAVGSRAEVEGLEEQAEALSETHAGRSFMITVDGHLPPWEVQAEWSATCRRDGDVPICRDRVELRFGVAAADRSASVVTALALSDVPLLVEAAPGAPSAVADSLAEVADRLIVDSAELPLARVADLVRRTRGSIADRAAIRTYSWRELVARFFDEAPGAWRAINRVEIARSSGSRPDPAAPLLGWLASRLGWAFEAKDRARDARGQPVVIAVKDAGPAQDEPSGRRRIEAVHLWAEYDGAPLALICARAPEAPNAVVWTMVGARSAAHVHPLGRREETWVLSKAIDATEGDRVTREALLAGAAWSAL